jgi:hypothetical protein
MPIINAHGDIDIVLWKRNFGKDMSKCRSISNRAESSEIMLLGYVLEFF